VNLLLYWEALRYAGNRGYKYFDFGRSTRDSGTFRFKQQWGAMPKTLYWHYWLNRTNELPLLNPTNPKYSMMINTWKRLPVVVTKLLGPMIVKNLP
ncbi:MAG: FemAB-like protein, partial [Pseudomonadota bacterium]